MGRDADLARLLKDYEDDGLAAWAYTSALLAYRLQGDIPASRAKLQAALVLNPHVPAYVLGRKPIPRRLPEYIRVGDETEAFSYAAENINGWRQSPGALEWLAGVAGTRA